MLVRTIAIAVILAIMGGAVPGVAETVSDTGSGIETKRTQKANKTETKQTDEVVLDEVVVTATADIKAVNTPAALSVITAEDIKKQGIKNIGEAIAKIPGVYEDGSSSHEFSVRGSRSSMSGGPLVLVDGVPEDSGMYGYNYFETIPVSEIERVEVLRSPGSTVFGVDSARGVISIITKKGKSGQPLRVETKVSAGSWDTYDESASLSGGVDCWDFAMNGSRTDTEGYAHDQQERSAGRFRAGYALSDASRLGVNLGYKANTWETVAGKNIYALENSRTADEFRDSPTAKLTIPNETDQKVASTALDYSFKGADFFVNSLVSYSDLEENYHSASSTYTSPKSVYQDDREQDRYTYSLSGGYTLFMGDIAYTPKIGTSLETTDLSQRRDYYNDRAAKAVSKRKADIDYDQERYGFFFQNQVLFGEPWELNAGIRYDEVSYEVENRNGNRVDTDPDAVSWSVAPAYHWNSEATTYVSAGKSSWFPVAYYYQAAMEKMNPDNLPEDLKPESSMVYEIGHKQRFLDNINVSLTLFWMEYQDKFAALYDDVSASSFQGYKNIGDSEHKGVEMEVDGRPFKVFGYRLSGTYMKAVWESGRESVYIWETSAKEFRNLNGYELPRLPNCTYTAGVDVYPMKNIRINFDMNGTGSYWVDYLNRIKEEGTVSFDTGVWYEAGKWSLWMLAKNLFDTGIETVSNLTGELNTTAAEISRNGLYDNTYYPRQGRYLEAGVSYRF